MSGWQRKILTAAVLLLAGMFSLLAFLTARAEINQGNVGINFSVPAICGNSVIESPETCDDGNVVAGDGCSSACVTEGGPGCSGDCTSPIVTFMSATVNQTSVVIKWKATDNVAVSATSLKYGISNYTTEAAGTSLGNHEYQVSLSGLTANATYSFQIVASDAASNNATPYAGTFITTSVPPDNPPQLTLISYSASTNTAVVNWRASDDKGLSAMSFTYGLTALYGLVEPVAVNQTGNYSKNLLGLLSDRDYYYKITATDSASQTTNLTGAFHTAAQDTTAPIIFNVAAVVAGVTTAQVTWETNEPANSEARYGLSDVYGGTASDSNLAVNHSLALTGLLPNTLYHYKVFSTDAANNTAADSDRTFTTQKDIPQPSNVSGLALAIVNNNAFKLDWTNPVLLGDNADFVGVKILRKIGSVSADTADGTVVYTGSASTFTDNNVAKNVRYYFTVFSYDTSDNYSSGVSVNGLIVGTEICNNSVDDDADGKVDCADSDCTSFCQPLVEICNDGLDNDSDGKTDCADLDCEMHPSCQPLLVENCNDTIDNDNDGAVDCADSDCAGSAFCSMLPVENKPTGGGAAPQCSDTLDNDTDGLIDFPADLGCVGIDDSDEYNPPSSTVPVLAKLKLEDVVFLTAKGEIALIPQQSIITSLTGSNLTVIVSQALLASSSVELALRLDGADNQFTFNATEQKYYAQVSFPAAGVHDAYLEANYRSSGFDSLPFKLQSLPYGRVSGENNKPLASVEVSLFSAGDNLISLAKYGQNNPFFSTANGDYGWVAPNGEYYLVARKDGYHEHATNVYHIKNNVVNFNLSLVKKVPKLEEVIDPNASLTKNVVAVVKNIAEKTAEATALVEQAVNYLVDNPAVEQAAKKVVAPAAVSAVAVSTLPFLSFSNLLPFLRLLFLQPLFLLGRRKREKWGQIYNALNKLPIDLALVRLINADTNQMVQSKVTDRQGRYAFIVEPGKYKLEVQKSNFVFPSVLLAKFKSDGRRVDIYHGEAVEVTEKDSVITANIPVDVAGETGKKPVRLFWGNIAHSLQSIISTVGFIITLVSLYVTPNWFIGSLLAIHVGMWLLFRRLAKPIKAKGWGIVYDAESRRPIGKTITRLFNAELNKLVASQVTDRRGRYYFLAGDDKYYVSFEHSNYQPYKTEVLDLTDKEADTVGVDVSLQRSGRATVGAESLSAVQEKKEAAEPPKPVEQKNKQEGIWG